MDPDELDARFIVSIVDPCHVWKLLSDVRALRLVYHSVILSAMLSPVR